MTIQIRYRRQVVMAAVFAVFAAAAGAAAPDFPGNTDARCLAGHWGLSTSATPRRTRSD